MLFRFHLIRNLYKSWSLFKVRFIHLSNLKRHYSKEYMVTRSTRLRSESSKYTCTDSLGQLSSQEDLKRELSTISVDDKRFGVFISRLSLLFLRFCLLSSLVSFRMDRNDPFTVNHDTDSGHHIPFTSLTFIS